MENLFNTLRLGGERSPDDRKKLATKLQSPKKIESVFGSFKTVGDSVGNGAHFVWNTHIFLSQPSIDGWEMLIQQRYCHFMQIVIPQWLIDTDVIRWAELPDSAFSMKTFHPLQSWTVFFQELSFTGVNCIFLVVICLCVFLGFVQC